MRHFAFACILLVIAGCLDQPAPSGYPPACSKDGPLIWGAFDGRTPTGWTPQGDPETDPRQPWKTVVALRGDPTFRLTPEWGNATLDWSGNGVEHLAIVSLEAPVEPVGLTVTAEGVDCVRFAAADWEPFAPAREGALAEVGKGALVYTAGFFENGTLFYTNMPEIHDGPEDGDQVWPRIDWYSWGGDAPLQVYVYDQDRSEIPPHWGDAGELPVDDPAGASPTRYFTTIRGFNEALKGLSTSTLTAVRIAPEDAYTRPGNEQHPLYGEPLVFLIRVAAVAEQPCPAQGFSPAALDAPPGCFRK